MSLSENGPAESRPTVIEPMHRPSHSIGANTIDFTPTTRALSRVSSGTDGSPASGKCSTFPVVIANAGRHPVVHGDGLRLHELLPPRAMVSGDVDQPVLSDAH